MRELELMGTLGCHLCEVAEAIILSAVDLDVYEIYQVDISDDDKLMEKYSVLIPVLVDVETANELRWPFGADELNAFLKRLSA